MTLNSDFILYHPLWERADVELVGKNSTIGLFNRLVDLYIVACSIGIRDDKQIEPDEPMEFPKSIGRDTYLSMANTDLKELFEFLIQNALLTSKVIDFDLEERIKLAFNPDYSVNKFSLTSFLNGFANYGLQKIFEVVDSQTAVLAIDGIYDFISSIDSSKYDELIRSITLEYMEQE